MPLGDTLPTPAGFETSYGDFSFSNYVYTEAFSAKPETNSAGQTTAFVRFTIRLRDYVEVTTGDPAAEQARRALQEQGQTFIYKGRATGDLVVNAGLSGPRDVKFGPVPQLIEFRKIPTAPTAS